MEAKSEGLPVIQEELRSGLQDRLPRRWSQQSKGPILPHSGRRLRRCCRHFRPVLLQRHPESTARYPAEGPVHWRLLQARDRTGGQPILDYEFVEEIGTARRWMKEAAGAWLGWGAVMLYSKRRRDTVRNVQMFRWQSLARVRFLGDCLEEIIPE